MNFDDLRSRYRAQSDDELDRLLGELDELEDDAKTLLFSELKARGRTDTEVSSLIARGRDRRLPLGSIEGIDPILTAWVGNVRRVNGTGRAFFGRTNCEYNPQYDYDEIDTTLWWTIFWVPIVPRGSFRIRRKATRPGAARFAGGHDYQLVIVRRLPFLWLANLGWLALVATLFCYFLGSALVASLLGHH
jgi:hypothetical protein